MPRQIRVSMLVAISMGLFLGFGAASLKSIRKSEVAPPIELPAPIPTQFQDNSGICCPDDVGCSKETSRAMVLTTQSNRAAAEAHRP